MPVATPDKMLSLIAPGAQVVVRDEECAIDEVDVRFYAAETVIERVEERAGVFVVVVGVGVG